MNVRLAQHRDFQSLLELNEESVRFLSPLSMDRLVALDREAALHLVIEHAGAVVAFLLGFREHANYDSVNYQWFELRYPSFLYIDRVVVGRNTQGEGAGTLLYKRAFAHAAETGIAILTCEFDVDPPNPVSALFHAKFGFHEVGRQPVANGKKYVSLQVAAAGHGPTTRSTRTCVRRPYFAALVYAG
jgi:uncharacterized protein